MIERQNILALLGSDKNKYHSCVITSYSFDFLFFEERIVPLLRHAGIININLIIDAGMLQQQLESKSINLLNGKKSYSIIPIEMKGAFHPKIFLATGKKKGFLAIGSGNITGSGMSSNQEIWSSFFISENQDHTAAVFIDVDTYLSGLYTKAYAINAEKIHWMKKNAPWFSEINKSVYKGDKLIHKDCSYQILSSNADQSLFKSLIDILPKEPIGVKILSPFYNPDGRLILNIINELNPQQIHCVIDHELGSIPYKFENQKLVQFSEWKKITISERYPNSRLHAKAYQFEYERSTYFLFGSANATEEAFGNMVENSKNAEICVLIKSDTRKDFFSELQIDFPEKGTYNLADYNNNKIQVQDVKQSSHFPVKLKHAELEFGTLTIYYSKQLDIDYADVKVFDTEDIILYNGSPIPLLEENSVYIGDDNCAIFKVALYQEDKRISNYCFIHHIAELNRTSPDNSLIRFNELISNEYISDLEMIELLEYAKFKPLQKNMGNGDLHSKSYSGFHDKNSGEVLTEKEFNSSAGYINRHTFHEHSTQIGLMEAFLNDLTFGRGEKSEDLKESEESAAMTAGDQGINEEIFFVGQNQFPHNEKDSFALKQKINSIFEKIAKEYFQFKELISKSNFIDQSSRITASFEEIQDILFGFHLFLGKRFGHFSEHRCILRIQIDKSKIIPQNNIGNLGTSLKKGLIDFEKDFQLIKCESQSGNTLNQITYTAKESMTHKIKDNSLNYEGIKVLYMDITPSQRIMHNYIDSTTWPESEKYSGSENMIIHGLGTFLLLLTQGEEQYQGKDLQRWLMYKERLFYKSLLTLLVYKWKEKTKTTRNLLMLNIFNLLLPEKKDKNEIIEILNRDYSKIGKDEPLSEIIIEEFEILLSKFKFWKEKFKLNDPSIIRLTSSLSVGSYIYLPKIGFSIFRKHIDNNLIHIESPLGVMNKKTKVYGFSDFFAGSKVKVFD